MDNRLYCATCEIAHSADAWSCDECFGHLEPLDPLPIHFSVATGQPSFTPSLTEPVYSEAFLRVRQAG